MKYPPRKSSVVQPGEVNRPVFGLDIDGTMGAYHEHFLKFARDYLGKQMPPTSYPGSSLAGYMGVSKSTYRQVKLAYRRGGMKRSMPCYPGAKELAAGLRKRGAVVVICTTRPFLQLDTVEPDTMHWLKRNGIQYDGIIAGERKYMDLARQFGPERVVCVLEDLPEMARQAMDCGVIPVIRDQPYNQPSDHPQIEYAPRAHDLYNAIALLHHHLNVWENNHAR